MQEKLIALRRYKGISQKEMAKMLGIDPRTYVNKEHGITQFKANEMFMIARVLQTEIEDIFLPTNFMNREVKEVKKAQ